MINLKGPTLGLSGRFKIDVANSKGELVKDKCSPEQDNLVTEAGLKAFLNASGYALKLVLGTGSTPPQREDTRLDNTLVAFNSTISYRGGVILDNGSAYEVTKEFVFALGQVIGNITELGLAYTYSNLSTYVLATRALIKDSAGNATSIEILEDEQIKITYTLRVDIDVSNIPYLLNIEKDGNLIEHTITPLFKIRHAASNVGMFEYPVSIAGGAIYATHTDGSSASSVAADSPNNNSSAYTGEFSIDRSEYTTKTKVFSGISKWVGNIRFLGVWDFMIVNGTGNFGITNNSPSIGTTFVWNVEPPIEKTNEQVIEIECSITVTYGD